MKRLSEAELEHKALEVMRLATEYKSASHRRKNVKDFIHNLYQEASIRKPKVNQKFMKKWNKIFDGGHGYPTFWEALEAMLKDAEVEVEE